MTDISITIHSKDGRELAACTGSGSSYVNLVYEAEYQEGDTITVRAEHASHLVLQLDDVLQPAAVYFSESTYCYQIPFGEKRFSYNPKTFSGSMHMLRARYATRAEILQYRNIAYNSHDTAASTTCFPHASANIETRGESVFAARNAIDGNTANCSHGNWPYESWGINRDPEAELYLNFGRPVTVDKLGLVTRADFPHDNYWKQASVTFSDGSEMSLSMERSTEPHEFVFEPKQITGLTLHKLIKDDTDPSPFPALTQLEVYGQDSL